MVGADGGNLFGVGREGEGGAVHAFLRDGLALAGGQVVDVEADAFARLVGSEENTFAVGEPVGPAVVDVVFGQVFRLAGAGGQEPKLRRGFLSLRDGPFAVGR